MVLTKKAKQFTDIADRLLAKLDKLCVLLPAGAPEFRQAQEMVRRARAEVVCRDIIGREIRGAQRFRL